MYIIRIIWYSHYFNTILKAGFPTGSSAICTFVSGDKTFIIAFDQTTAMIIDVEENQKQLVRNLPGMNKHILLSCGLSENNIHIMNDTDTYSDSDMWHSYRRGPIIDDRHLNGMNGYFIKLK